MVRFDTAQAQGTQTTLSTLVRGVQTTRGQPVFGGAGATATAKVLEPDFNSLRFEVAAPTFLDEETPSFRRGSMASTATGRRGAARPARDFTNLGFGDFRFHVGRATSPVRSATRPPMPSRFSRRVPDVVGVRPTLLLGAGLASAACLQRRRLLGKERERAQFAEAKLRAEAAEALARTESEGKKQVELLSGIGREITASLDFDTIFGKLYERVNQLADADVFGVGLYHPERQEIEYRLAIEEGKRYAPYTRDTSDPDQLPVWCIQHRQPVFINDLAVDHKKYVSPHEEKSQRLEDGSMSKTPQSLIYLPLEAKDRVLGLITIQSFEKNAYTDHHLNVMQAWRGTPPWRSTTRRPTGS